MFNNILCNIKAIGFFLFFCYNFCGDIMQIVNEIEDYKVLKLGNGEKIESWNGIILKRPETSAIFENNMSMKVDAVYKRSNTGGGSWNIINKNLPDCFQIKFKDLVFNLKLMGFKHTGLFPEQAYNWNYLINKIKCENRKINVLNLFAYTGGATVSCMSAGANVVHVDSSRGMVDWAKENIKSSNIDPTKVRLIVDDVKAFVKKEIRRGHKYDIIIMDPPTFGRGNKKQIGNIEKDLYPLVKNCSELLSDNPCLFLINSYSNGITSTAIENILKETVSKKFKGYITSSELGFKVENSDLVMPCGYFTRWEKNL